MTPQEKAAQLVVDYQIKVRSLDYKEAVQCAIVTVDEIIDAVDWHEFEVPNDVLHFYFEVKKVLEKL
jgi:hypothetical protein